MSTHLNDASVLVIGASSGIGRAMAARFASAGARVAAVARRREALEDLIAKAGSGTAIVADLANPDDVGRIAAEASDALGPIDIVVIAAATAHLGRLDSMTPEQWATTLNTNLVGTNLAIAQIIPHLSERAIVVVLSSESAGNPFYGLGAYAASKSAVEDTLRGWRVENPGVRFLAMVVGVTVPSDFASGFDGDELVAAMPIWAAQGNAPTEFMQRGEVAAVALDMLGTLLVCPSVGVETMVLRSPSPLAGTGDVFAAQVAEHGLSEGARP